MFASAPDYENPTDMGGDNMYNVMVVAEAEGRVHGQPFAVTKSRSPTRTIPERYP